MPSTLLWNLHEGSLRALPLTHHGVLHGDVLAPEAACWHLLDVARLPRVQDSVWTTHYQREQLFVALVLRITTKIWLGWDLLHCSPALSPPPLRHFGGIKEDILRIIQGFMIPCCRRTRHWTLQTLPAPVLPHNSLAGTLIVTIFHQVPLNPGHSWRWYKLFCTLGN